MINGIKKFISLSASFIGFVILSVIIQSPVVSWLGNEHVDISEDWNGHIFRIVLFIFLGLLSFYLVSHFAKRVGIVWERYSFREGNNSIVTLYLYIAFTLLMTLVYLFILYIGNGYNVGAVPNQILMMRERPVIFILYVCTAVVSQPILEELLFRGILQEKLSRYSIFGGLLISSIAFSYSHDYETIINSQLISSFIYGLAYVKTKNIKVPILLHSLQNLLVISFVIFFK